MSVCTFFGHRECCGLDAEVLRAAMESVIKQGCNTFYVGHQGGFDAMVLHELKRLRVRHPHIRCFVVLAYLPTKACVFGEGVETIYPEGMELGPPRFAVDRRNRWMIRESDWCLCCVDHTWGGAFRYASLAKRQGKTVINLYGRVKL